MFKPTEEQLKIFATIKKRPEDILIEAYAGTGKTTTIVNAIRLLPKDKRILFLAFNKHIQEELKGKLPDYVNVYTTYGIGNSAVLRKYKSIKFDQFKVDNYLMSVVDKWKISSEFEYEDDLMKYLNNLKQLVNLSRLSLALKEEHIASLIGKYDINLNTDVDVKRAFKVLTFLSIDRKTYDYTDMIFLPVIDKSIWFYPYDYVFIDEVQDLNRCQINIVQKNLKKPGKKSLTTGRLISVGDKNQSIYGFNASSEKGFEWFRERENTKVLPLSYSFRCAKNIIAEANKIVPQIKSLPLAPDGIVREGKVLEEVKVGDFVLCRITVPLIVLFYLLLDKKIKAKIKGSDVGSGLVEMTKSHKNIDELIKYWNKKLENLKMALISKNILDYTQDSSYISLEDSVNTLTFMAKKNNSIEDLIKNIEDVFSDNIDDNWVTLSTIHKVKGLEADRVFIIRPDKLPLPVRKKWQIDQEMNLKYVAITRAKSELVYDMDFNDENY